MDFILFVLKIIEIKMNKHNGITEWFIIESVCNTMMPFNKRIHFQLFLSMLVHASGNSSELSPNSVRIRRNSVLTQSECSRVTYGTCREYMWNVY